MLRQVDLKNVLILIIKGYQKGLSPLLGSRCRYYPTCSSYAVESIETYGAFKGLWMSLKRIGRCHPLAEGGFDPVPHIMKEQENHKTHHQDQENQIERRCNHK